VHRVEDTSPAWLEEFTLVKPYNEEATFEEFSTTILSASLSTTPSHLHAFYNSPGDLKGFLPSSDPYYAYLQNGPRKIMRSTFFDHAFDFCVALGEFKRPLTLFALSLLVFSYSHYSEMHATTYDKLLKGLTTYR